MLVSSFAASETGHSSTVFLKPYLRFASQLVRLLRSQRELQAAHRSVRIPDDKPIRRVSQVHELQRGTIDCRRRRSAR